MDEVWTTSTPFTYVIDYGFDHVNNPDFIKRVAEAPPFLLHVGHDVPFTIMYGPMPGYKIDDVDAISEVLSPEDTRKKFEEIRRYVEELRSAGVKVVISYICHGLIIGDDRNRTGFWNFYDNWEKYAEFGFGRKPKEDPVEWMERKKTFLRGGYYNLIRGPFARSKSDPTRMFYWYQPCARNDNWRNYVRVVVENIAKVGYDGVFIDVNATECYCDYCQKSFKEYLRNKFSNEELRKMFGTDDISSLELAEQPVRTYIESEGGLKKGERKRIRILENLWAETQRFRNESIADFHRFVKESGRRYKKDFFLVVNLGPMAHIKGVYSRRDVGINISRWAKSDVNDVVMFEEMQQPGVPRPDFIHDSILQYKIAYAARQRAGILLYRSQDEHSIALSNAEAGAGGGGTFIQAGYAAPEIRNRYNRFFSENSHLFEGLRPVADVAVAFSLDQVYYDNTQHLRDVYRIRQYLSNNHVLFDFVVEDSFSLENLSKYRVLIFPDVEFSSSGQVEVLRRYIEKGGNAIFIGKVASFDEFGDEMGLSFLGDGEKDENGLMTGSYGDGRWVLCERLSEIIPETPFEIFDQTEDLVTDTDQFISWIDRVRSERKPSGRDLLCGYLEVMSGRDPRVAPEGTPAELRISAFSKEAEGLYKLIVHLVNYNVPYPIEGNPEGPIPCKDVHVSIPLPVSAGEISVKMYDPDAGSPANLTPILRGGNLEFEVPEVTVYRVIEVEVLQRSQVSS